jgi:hypothetical protein
MPSIRKTAVGPRGLVRRSSQSPSAAHQQQPQQKRPPVDEDEQFDEDILDDSNEGENEGYHGGGNDDAFDIGGMDFDDDPMSTFGADPNYNQAVAKGQYIRVHFIKPLRKHITQSTLLPDTKATLNIFAEGLFDKTQVLAKRNNLRLAEIEMDIMLAQARIGFHQVDVDNPDLANVTNLMRNMYIGFISRSEGGWERELDNRIETSHTNRVVDDRMRMGGMMGGGGPPKSSYPVWHPKRWF